MPETCILSTSRSSSASVRPGRLLLGIWGTAALLFGATALAAPVYPPTRGPSVCGGFPPADGGPHDYRKVRDWRLSRVERFHFTPNVEKLVRGQSGVNIGSDLGFTLRHFPNHHRALLSMMRLGEKQKTDQPVGSLYELDCWMDRAVRFAPDDNVARMIYVEYLRKNGREADAMAHLEVVVELAGDNPFTHYNAGLLYGEMKRYDRALVQAHRAMALGLDRPGLRGLLTKAGQWKEPEGVVAASAGAGSDKAASASAEPAASGSVGPTKP